MSNKDFQNGFAVGLASGSVIEVEIPAKEEQEKTITITENGTTEILPDENKALSKVTVVTDVSSSGATLNIAYGETPPEDTSKLWIKAGEPANVSVGSDFDGLDSISLAGNLPKGIQDMACARVGTKIYLFGGKDNDWIINTINVFNTETGEITTLTATLPSACNLMTCAAVGNKIYLFGGFAGTSAGINTINVFNTETGEITTSTTKLPSNRMAMTCAAVGNKIYLFGGYQESNYHNTIYVFNTETEQIRTLTATLPYKLAHISCSAIGNKIYLFGGRSKSTYYNTICVFNTETEQITTLTATLPSAIASVGCEVVGNKVYLFGGRSESTYSTAISLFDPQTETLTPLTTNLTIARAFMGCSSLGTNVYLFGGLNVSAKDIIEKFTLTHELANGDIELQSGLLKNKFNLINTDTAQIEIGVENVYIGNMNNEAELCEAYLHNGAEWVVI